MNEEHHPLFAAQDRYRFLRVLGRGAFGTVLLVQDAELGGARVALKLLRDAPTKHGDLKREFRQLRGVSHPHVVDFLELVVNDEFAFFTMAYVPGQTMGIWAASIPPGGQRTKMIHAVVRQSMQGLQALQLHGLRHGDIKADNIIVRTGLKGPHAVLVDFGLAANLDHTTPEIAGTLAYMAPEVLHGLPGPRSDVYSLGAVAFEILVGHPPWPNGRVTERLFGRPPRVEERVDGVPPELAHFVDRCLSLQQDQRPTLGIADSLDAHGGLDPVRHVGRGDVLARLDEVVAHAAGPTVVRLHGETGIGKSTTLSRWIGELRQREVTVFTSCCRHFEAVPFNALDELVEMLARRVDAQACRRDIQLAAQVFEPLRALLGAAEPASGTYRRGTRERGVEALARLFCVTLPSRSVFVVDDAQWMDDDSESVIRQLLATDLDAIWVLSHREDESGAALTSLVEDCATRFEVVSVEMRPLEPTDAQALLTSTANRDLSTSHAKALVEASGGSPFMLGIFADALSRGVDAGSLLEAEPGGGSLHDLADDAHALLRIAAVAFCPLSADALVDLAGGTQASWVLLRSMMRRRLLRIRPGTQGVEVYHDRVGVLVRAGIKSSELRQLHARLASALDGDRATPAEPIARHLHASGAPDRAAKRALMVAEEASNTLAFQRASEWFGKALEWSSGDLGDRTQSVRSAHADATFNAGRCGEAGPLYRALASDMTNSALAREARRRAAESYLSAGFIQEGIEDLQELGLQVPRWPMLSLVGGLGRTLWRERRMEPEALCASETRVDDGTCDLEWVAGKGLVYVLPFEGTSLIVRSLQRAVDMGDPHRTGRAMAFVGGGMFTQFGALAPRAARYLAQSEQLAEATDDAYLRAMVLVCRGMAASFLGDWQRVLSLSEQGLQRLRRDCVGTAWEETLASGLTVYARIFLGEVHQAREGGVRHLTQAEACGDLYGQVMLRQFLCQLNLVEGRPERARAQIDWCRRHWKAEHYTVNWFYTEWLDCWRALYEGDPDEAWRIYTSMLPPFRSARGYDSPISRFDMLSHESRLRLAKHDATSTIAAVSKRLATSKRLDSIAFARLVDAALLLRTGQVSGARARLAHAREIFESRHMGMGVDVVNYALARLDGASDLDAADALHQRGVGAPERWARAYLPGGRLFIR